MKRLAGPELTGTTDIKLNERVSLRCHVDTLLMLHRTLPYVRYYPPAKPSGDHIPLGGFVFL